MYARKTLTQLTVAALSALLVAGCTTKTPDPDPIEPGPHITSFTTSASDVQPGTAVTLTWAAEFGATATLTGEGGATTDVEPNGTTEVTVNKTTLFVLTVRNARGATDRATVAVRLNTSAHDLLLYALPSNISAGDQATLAWSAPDAQQVSISANPGGALNLNGQVQSGTVAVSPTATTTYTLTADGKTATTKIDVSAKVSSFTATPTSATRGGTVSLAWTTAGAVQATLTAAGRGVLLDTQDAAKVASGSFDDAIPANADAGAVYTYELAVRDSAGAISKKTLTVYVQGAPVIVDFTAPKLARLGQTFTLSWHTRQSEAVRISVDGAAYYDAPDAATIASGSLTLNTPTATTSYTITATDSRGGSATQTVSVEPVGAPSIASFSATPNQVTNGGTPVTLSWNASYARIVKITERLAGTVYSGTGALDVGTASVTPSTSAVYTLTIENGFGETATATAQVAVTNPLTLTPSLTGTVASGTQLTLSWTYGGGSAQISGLPHSVIDYRATSTGFEDISTTGTLVTFSSYDDGATTINPNFTTRLFGKTVGNEVVINTNGYITFGSYSNKSNYTPSALPTSKLEPLSIAGAWDDLSLYNGDVYWQLKGTAADPVLIVQWQQAEEWSYSGDYITFQIKVHHSGQVDIEYKDTTGFVSGTYYGIQGPDPRWALVPTTAPTSGSGYTYFAPKSSPVPVTLVSSEPLLGEVNGVTIAYAPSVVTPTELSINEVMNKPDPSLGQNGQWLELANNTPNPVDLTGWSLPLADGGSMDLSGTIAANSAAVFGTTTDGALNGDAGVQVAPANFGLSSSALSLALTRGSALNTLSSTSPYDAGVALVNDVGPFRMSSDSSTTAWKTRVCAATQSYSSAPASYGTPGTLSGCGFGYGLQRIPGGFYDISKTGTARFGASWDSDLATLDLSSAPFPFFGNTVSSLIVSANGLITADSAVTATSYLSSAVPSTSAPNSVMAVFAYNLLSNGMTGSNVYTRRVPANEDPAAAPAHWIIQWSHAKRTTGDDFNFQAKLFDDGTIEYHFAEMRSGSSSVYGSGYGADSWLENATGTQVLIINAMSSYTPGIGWNSGYRFVRR